MRKFRWLKSLWALGLLCTVAVAIAAVPGIFTTVNATTGYLLNGAAGSAGQALCSDGTYFDTPCTPSGTGITALTGPVTASGSGSVATTITATGVTAASYTLANVTVNAAGQITAASNGIAVESNVTGSRSFGSVYQNTSGYPMELMIECNGLGASGGARVNLFEGASSSPPQIGQSSNNNNGITITKMVPNTYYYEATCTSNGGSPTLDLTNWIETTLQ